MFFHQETINDSFIEEIAPLLQAHCDEVTHYKDIKLNPDLKRYKSIEEQGNLKIFTAREGNGDLVGYSVFFLSSNIHYMDSLQAMQDIIYIDPKKRGFGMRFILWCDEQLKKDGVQVVYQHVKASHDFGPMLERIGYEKIDLIYGRRLDG